jgi:hypothetical protein
MKECAMEIKSRSDGITDYGAYAYRAWAAKDALRTSPWEAWFEIHMPDYKTIVCGPKKLPEQFASGEEAFAAAEEKVNHAIGGQTKQLDC